MVTATGQGRHKGEPQYGTNAILACRRRQMQGKVICSNQIFARFRLRKSKGVEESMMVQRDPDVAADGRGRMAFAGSSFCVLRFPCLTSTSSCPPSTRAKMPLAQPGIDRCRWQA